MDRFVWSSLPALGDPWPYKALLMGKQDGSEQPGRGLTGKPVTERSIPPLRLLSETKVEESASCPEPPQPDPAEEVSGSFSSSILVLVPVLEESLVFLCEKNPFFTLPSS